ncbi:hypothetical protein ACVW1C_000805 [Bradyrhizobium sp. USDA 4011]
MHSAAATISRSPRQAPGGAVARPESSTIKTPRMVTSTPVVFRAVSGSAPSAAPTSMVSSGSVESASAPRAAVVKISEALNRTGNAAKNKKPRPATPSQSRRGGQLPRCNSASGSSSRTPMPKRKAPIASGSMAPTRNRVAPIEIPPSALDATAANTPQISPIPLRPLCFACAI